MTRAEILACVQERLIRDLTAAVARARERFAPRMRNAWVFERLDRLVRSLQPARVEGIAFGREEFERELSRALESQLPLLRKHFPEVREKDLRRLVKTAGRMFAALSERAEAELRALEGRAKGHKSARQLVEKEFARVRPFKSRKEHEKWAKAVHEDLGELLAYFAGLGGELSRKTGFVWTLKLAAARAYLAAKLGAVLELDSLERDLELAKQAVLDAAAEFERALMDARY